MHLNLLEFLDGQSRLRRPAFSSSRPSGCAKILLLQSPLDWLGFAAANVWPALLYFPFHSLHDRVQGTGHALSIRPWRYWRPRPFRAFAGIRSPGKVVQVSRILALPVAAAILTVAYAQAFFACSRSGGAIRSRA